MSATPLRILMSRQAAAQLAAPVQRVLAGRAHALVAPDHPDAALADIAFVSRDVTGTLHSTSSRRDSRTGGDHSDASSSAQPMPVGLAADDPAEPESCDRTSSDQN